MGRPVNKRKIGYGTGRIAVSRHYFTSGAEATTAAHIYKQKGDSKFWVRLDSQNADPTAGETLKLVNKAGTGGGQALAPGEFTIDARGSDSTIYQVTKLRNKTVQIEGSGAGAALPNAENVIYNIGIDADNREDADVPNAVLSVELPKQ